MEVERDATQRLHENIPSEQRMRELEDQIAELEEEKKKPTIGEQVLAQIVPAIPTILTALQKIAGAPPTQPAPVALPSPGTISNG
jgi:hypothetical protein